MRALLVEDDPSTRHLIELILTKRGHDVSPCENAEEGWEAYQKSTHSLAVIDLMLPGKRDGLDLCRQIRTHPDGDTSALIVCTARSQSDDLEAVLGAGADDYISKPFDPRTFGVRMHIAEHLAGARTDVRLIQRSLNQMRDNVELAGAAVIGKTLDGTIVSWNTCAEQVYGHLADEVKGRSIEVIVPEDKRAEEHEMLARVGTGEKINEFETVRVHKSGERIPVMLNCAPIFDAARKIVGANIVTRDLSSTRRVEEKLRITEEKLRGLFESNMFGMLFWDATGRITNANDTLLNLIQYTRAELADGRLNWKDLTPPEYEDLDLQAVKQVELTGRCDPYEKEFIRKGGARVPVLIGGAGMKQAGAEGVAFVFDLSHKKQLEEQLRQSQKMEAIGRLAGGIAHDFNNLLTVIIGRVDLALSQMPPSAPYYKSIDLVRSTGARAAALTRQLLQFSRQQVLQPRVVNLNSICEDMREMLERLVGESIELSIRCAPRLPMAKVDPAQIQQVILNLVVNGRDAIVGAGKITIETAEVELDEEYTAAHVGTVPGPHVMLSVADTGSGMSDATRARLFEPFFTTKEQGKGTGLGLSTVYGIVKQSGGDIWVYSEPGHGTIFKVYFPSTTQAPSAESSMTLQSIQQGNETLLVVEDEESIALLLKDILTKAGYNLLVASGPLEALELSQKSGPIDLLLTDVSMPKMSGHDLARQFSTLRPAMKVLYMSGYTSNAMGEQGVIDSSVAILEKPFTPRSLLSKIRQVLDADRVV